MRRAKRSRSLDPMISMINVVFLLLAFFMTGRFVEPEPASFSWPQGVGKPNESSTERVLISADGTVHFRGAQGYGIWNRLSQDEVSIAADARLDANVLIEILSDFQTHGVKVVGVEVQE